MKTGSANMDAKIEQTINEKARALGAALAAFMVLVLFLMLYGYISVQFAFIASVLVLVIACTLLVYPRLVLLPSKLYERL